MPIVIGSLRVWYAKKADMSDLELNQLRSIREDFVRVDTLCAANDIISNHIQSLPTFKQWNLVDDKVLADADGQKISTTDSGALCPPSAAAVYLIATCQDRFVT